MKSELKEFVGGCGIYSIQLKTGTSAMSFISTRACRGQ